MRSTKYADEIASADEGGARIERLRIRSTGAAEIRFSWWKNGRFQPRPLDLPEDDLLRLLRKAIDEGVFSEIFVGHLRQMLGTGTSPAIPEHSMVTLSGALTLKDGRTLPEGARGAIVFVHGDGEAYEVEFIAPFHAVTTVPASSLSRAPAA
ncbi:DUF4926 domain-containing protein [Methylobacterium sp. J-088]|uniref:DUF4926 domain-containing protein n=1 Tax=Methylobacterium sp. J-088 TaxID=2836664 RepID=UPI001FBC03DB|nr:DUF4926 domain-containing protein [Methylobacterium sp. J-088]MCJ2061275.1 DUF4926 domain-containing protein [Methylobacterium sp. J-088]